MTEPAAIKPDTKDWTWVLGRPCQECGFDAADVDRRDLGRIVRDNAACWERVLAAPAAATRREQTVWSPTEYAAHVRDVHRIFGERLTQMLTDDNPRFANWDQDETAVAERYDLQLPDRVGPELVDAAARIAAAYDAVPDDAWQRPGMRSNGTTFTVETLGKYHLHDVVHHLWDVRWVHDDNRSSAGG